MEDKLDLEEKREELRDVYAKWQKEIDSSFLNERYSYPYYISIPDDWFEETTRIRIMIVGEEGAGEKDFTTSIEDAQEFNLQFMNSQIGKSMMYAHRQSAFWRRFNCIAKSIPNSSVCWNNIDKIHISKRRNCKLSDSERIRLHQTSIRILQEEIRILEPTHIVFFGWYGSSLQAELPEVFQWLYPGGLNDSSMWKGGKPLSHELEDKTYVFSYHPGWRNKPKDYEDTVLQVIIDAVEKYLQRTIE